MPIGLGLGGFQFNHASIMTLAPTQPGVYAIYNSHFWIYVGESGDIQARLLQHLQGDNSCITRSGPTGFQFDLVFGQVERGARQDHWIAELSPICSQNTGSGSR